MSKSRQDIENEKLLLEFCFRDGNVHGVKGLLDRGVDINTMGYGIKTQGGKGWATPLIIAATNGCTQIVNLLLEHKDKSGKYDCKIDSNEQSALHIAASKGYLDIVKLLLQRGADKDAVCKTPGDFNTYTPIQLAIENGHLEVTETLLNAGANLTPDVENLWCGATLAHQAAKAGRVEILKLLLDKKVCEIDEGDSKGHTILMYACMGSDFSSPKEIFDTVEFCLRNGADVNKADNFGLIPLHYAVANNREKIVIELIKKCADKNKVTKDGRTTRDFTHSQRLIKIIDTTPSTQESLEKLISRLEIKKREVAELEARINQAKQKQAAQPDIAAALAAAMEPGLTTAIASAMQRSGMWRSEEKAAEVKSEDRIIKAAP